MTDVVIRGLVAPGYAALCTVPAMLLITLTRDVT
jgi:hypothetical protein